MAVKGGSKMNNASDVKDANMSAVLTVIHNAGSVSRGNIASELGLTTVTVNKLVAELCDNGICVETGEYVSYGGRKAALYRINSDYGVILGVMLARSGVYFSVYDFSLRKLEEEVCAVSLDDVNQVLLLLIEKLGAYSAKYAEKKVLGAGICIPGRASKDGVVIDMPDYPQWNSLDLAGRIKTAVHLNVYVDNDANSIAMSAKWRGFAGNTKNFVYLKLDEGLGAGVMVDGVIFGGSSNCGCELGHTTINVNGITCKCGRRGCAQAYLAHSTVMSRISEKLGREVDGDEAVRLYKEGNETVRTILNEFTEYLGVVLDNAFFIFDTEAVILQNFFASSIPELAVKLQGSIFENNNGEVVRSFRHRPPVYIMNDDRVIDSAPAVIVYEKIMKCEY